MPFQYTIDRSASTAYVIATGEINSRSCLKQAHDLTSDPNFRPEFNVLADLRYAKWSPTPNEAFDLGQAVAQFQDRFLGKIAVLANVQFERHSRSTSRTAQANGFRIRVFSGLDTAIEWLGLDT